MSSIATAATVLIMIAVTFLFLGFVISRLSGFLGLRLPDDHPAHEQPQFLRSIKQRFSK